MASFEVPGIIEDPLEEGRERAGPVAAGTSGDFPGNVRLTSSATMEQSHPGQTLGQNALAERLLKAIETTLTLAAPAVDQANPKRKKGGAAPDGSDSIRQRTSG